ncbi:MAG: hypothetical protein WA890_31010 [Micromonospora sp.]
MSRRGGQLTRVTLRLGLLVGGMVAGWCAYSAVCGDAAYAADAPPRVTANGTTDLPRISLSPDLRLTETQSAQTSVRFRPVTRDGGTVTTADPSRVSTGSRAGWEPRPDGPATSPRHRTEKAAPARPDRPAARTPAKTGPGTEPTRSPTPATPTARVRRPVAKPDTGPVPSPVRPGTGTSRPVDSDVPSLEPQDDTHVPPASRGTEDATEPPSPDAGQTPAGPTPIARTARGLAPAVPVIVGLLAVPHRHAKVGDWPPPQGEATAGRAPDPTPPDAEPASETPAPRPGSVGTSQAGHADAADTSGAAWAPPVTLAQRCGPDRAGDLPSRSPRPGTRPA